MGPKGPNLGHILSILVTNIFTLEIILYFHRSLPTLERQTCFSLHSKWQIFHYKEKLHCRIHGQLFSMTCTTYLPTRYQRYNDFSLIAQCQFNLVSSLFIFHGSSSWILSCNLLMCDWSLHNNFLYFLHLKHFELGKLPSLVSSFKLCIFLSTSKRSRAISTMLLQMSVISNWMWLKSFYFDIMEERICIFYFHQGWLFFISSLEYVNKTQLFGSTVSASAPSSACLSAITKQVKLKKKSCSNITENILMSRTMQP